MIIVEKIDKNEKSFDNQELITDIKNSLDLGHSIKDISQNLSEIYGIHKKEIYKLVLEISKNGKL